MYVKQEWVTVAEAKNGFDQNIQINHNSTMYKPFLGILGLDIRMIDHNGNVVWEEKEAVPGGQRFKSFWCGSNVRKVQVKYQYGSGYVSARLLGK